MKFADTLKSLSLDELLILLPESQRQLQVSIKNNEDDTVIRNNQKLVENIQNEIIIRRAELPPLK